MDHAGSRRVQLSSSDIKSYGGFLVPQPPTSWTTTVIPGSTNGKSSSRGRRALAGKHQATTGPSSLDLRISEGIRRKHQHLSALHLVLPYSRACRRAERHGFAFLLLAYGFRGPSLESRRSMRFGHSESPGVRFLVPFVLARADVGFRVRDFAGVSVNEDARHPKDSPALRRP